jgi:hypothetical protein
VNHRRPVTLPAPDTEPVERLIAQTRRRGAEPDTLTAGARWNRPGDIPGGVYFGALEVLGGG